MDRAKAKTFSGGRFRVRRQIGKGGMGVVYEAFDKERDMNVALKTLLQLNSDNLYYFKKEFRTLHDLVHPNLCAFMELIEDDGIWLLTMELVNGVDFLSHVEKDAGSAHPKPALSDSPGGTGPLGGAAPPTSTHSFDEDKLRSSLAGLCEGLNALHLMGRIHRDVKPSNVLVTEEDRVVLLDFGLVVNQSLRGQTDLLSIVGTAEYMAPEQANSEEVGPAADWYSVGVMLYEAMTGALPFEGKPLQVMRDKLEQEPIRPRDKVTTLPNDLEMLCVELLRINPTERPSAAEILDLVQVHQPRPVLAATTDLSRHTFGSIFVGREDELHLLEESFRVTRKGEFQSVIVEGVSGVGKSTLVKEFTLRLRDTHPSVVVLRGRCYERETAPYKGFDGIIDSLISYLRFAPAAEVLELEPRNSDLLLRLFPALERSDLFAQVADSPIEIEDPHELKNRAFGAMREMLLKLSRQHPVVIIVDDLQWLDGDTKQLLAYLVDASHRDPLELLFILSARYTTEKEDSVLDGESVFPHHKRIQLATLEERDAREFARQAIARGHIAIDVDPAMIAAEASGHPLYISELVGHIAGGGTDWRNLRLDDVIVHRVNTLPSLAKHLLETICILGTPFSREYLQNLTYLASEDFIESLAILRASNLVRSSGPRKNHLVEPYHDRVREAVTKYLRETDEAKMMHLEIGRFFLNTYSDSEIRGNIFDVVRHFDEGLDLISDETEKRHLAQLYFIAGQTASRLAAYATALSFFTKGIDFSSLEDWEENYDAIFALYSAAAECAYINGDFSLTKELVSQARPKARTDIDQAKICETYVLSLAADGEPLAAVDQALLMMRKLGVKLPLRPSKLSVLWRLIATKLRFVGKTREQLVNLPLATDSKIGACMNLLYLLGDISYYHLPNLWAVNIFKGVAFSLKYGIDRGSSVAFVSWGIILLGLLKKFRIGYKYGKIGLELTGKFEDSAFKAQTMFIWANFVQHWRDHIRDTLPYMLESHKMADRMGNIPYLAYSGTNYCYHSFFAGKYLPEVAEDFVHYGVIIENKKQEISYRTNRIFFQTTLNLVGKSDNPLELRGAAYDPKVIGQGDDEKNQRPNLFVHHFCALMLKVYFRCSDGAMDLVTQSHQYADAAVGTYRRAVLPFYASLACCHSYADADRRSRRTLRRRIRQNQKAYRKIALSSPANHAHKYKLVEAERARIRGLYGKARTLYEQTIAMAVKNDFVQDAALACECAAECYRETSEAEQARYYALAALAHYENWGALAKVADLKEKFAL